jgi:hypothetical protein
LPRAAQLAGDYIAVDALQAGWLILKKGLRRAGTSLQQPNDSL